MANSVYPYPYFVEYKDNLTGIVSCEAWSERVLNEEVLRDDVEILYIDLVWGLQVELGMVED